jgi:hypothetical protein
MAGGVFGYAASRGGGGATIRSGPLQPGRGTWYITLLRNKRSDHATPTADPRTGPSHRCSRRVRRYCRHRRSQAGPAGQGATATAIAASFNDWAAQNQLAKMGRNKVISRLTSIDGVQQVRIGEYRARGYNVILARPA